MAERAEIGVIAGVPSRHGLWIGLALVVLAASVGLALVASPAPNWVGRAAILSLVVLAVGLVRAQFGALALMFVLFTRLPDLSVYGQPAAIAEMIVALPILAMVTYQLATRRVQPATHLVPIGMLGYAAVALISAIAAQSPISGLAEVAAQLREVGLVFVLATLVTGLAGLRRATWTLIVAATFAAVTGLVGEAIGQDLGGLAIVEQSHIVGPLNGSRLGGLMHESNWFALMLVPVVPLAFYRAWYESRAVLRVGALAAAGLVSLAIVLTFSRGGFLGLLAALGCVAVRQRARPARLLVLLLVPVLLVVTTPLSYWQRMSTLEEFTQSSSPGDESLRDRLTLVKTSVLMLADHPFMGIGAGNYARLYPEYVNRVDPTLVSRKELLTSHSGPIQIAVDSGVAGLAAFGSVLLFAGIGTRQAARYFRRSGSADGVVLLEGVAVSVGAYLVASLFMDSSYNRYFWMLIGLLIIGQRAAQALSGDAPGRIRPAIPLWRSWPRAIIGGPAAVDFAHVTGPPDLP
jgi:putative inorganic carbon (hco3(-)) transporter